ncbi:MAG: UDP-3-O-acyl-N-acetylglucosamine deacetylase [Holosporaceae bacterium]|jgi:UDP-3-O-[3-hydroxymyristoyl] N-acetylglucosamine deacetylase|nr:UDP-3-O-acyl-N-acetylglucosamine deacetylase [Holosporaceae bacterium]
MLQRTIASHLKLEGVGLHSGKKSSFWIFGAPEDSGLKFVRLDADGPSGETWIEGEEHPLCIPADYRLVSDTNLGTKLTNGAGVSVATVEHLLAALYGLGISNAIIALEGEEIPGLDGSAKIIAEEICHAKIKEQRAAAGILKVLRPIKVGSPEKWASLAPADRLRINMRCDFSHRGLATPLDFSHDFSEDNFMTAIAPARTFGFFEDAEFLKRNHLALGSSLENTVVFDTNGLPLNESGLRFVNEPVRHKILDAAGDLALSGYRIHGQYDGFCSGHQLNNLLLRELFSSEKNYEIV